jgi:hypothetical protein
MSNSINSDNYRYKQALEARKRDSHTKNTKRTKVKVPKTSTVDLSKTTIKKTPDDLNPKKTSGLLTNQEVHNYLEAKRRTNKGLLTNKSTEKQLSPVRNNNVFKAVEQDFLQLSTLSDKSPIKKEVQNRIKLNLNKIFGDSNPVEAYKKNVSELIIDTNNKFSGHEISKAVTILTERYEPKKGLDDNKLNKIELALAQKLYRDDLKTDNNSSSKNSAIITTRSGLQKKLFLEFTKNSGIAHKASVVLKETENINQKYVSDKIIKYLESISI